MVCEREKLIERFLQAKEDEVSLATIDNNFYYYEIFSDGDIRSYLVCDYTDALFRYEDYSRAKELVDEDETKNGFFTPVFIFVDLNDENKQYEAEYNKVKKANEKRALTELFDTKVSLYTAETNLTLYVEDDGINYLEYKSKNGELCGFIYNLSYKELEKLFLVKGKDLFRENIRFGITGTNSVKRKLRENFKNYVNHSIKQCLIEKEYDIEYIKTFMEKIGAEESNVEATNPELFWYKHNGVTIFVTDKKISRMGNTVKFDAKNANIINGAQTITNLYGVIREQRQLIVDKVGAKILGMDDSNKNTFEELIDEIFERIKKSIYVKAIFIEGENKYVKTISDGLNTQIPITEVDTLANGDSVGKLNKLFLRKRVQIIKPGEVKGKGRIDVLECAKYIKMIKQNPGTSKNLNRARTEEILKEIANQIEKGEEGILNNMALIIEADEWWTENAERVLASYKSEVAKKLLRFGKNYFCSYIVHKVNCKEKIDENGFESLCVSLLNNAELAEGPKEVDDFRKDALYREIISIDKAKQLNQNIKELLADNAENIEAQINETDISLDSIKKVIIEFFSKENIDITKLKLVRFMKQNEKLESLDSVSFSVDSFLQLLDIYENEEKSVEDKFDESLFKRELIENYKVIYIYIDEEKKCQGVYYNEELSFKKFESEAMKLFGLTLEMFDQGDEEFAKEDNREFGVQKNSNERFVYTNGNEIYYQSFVATKQTLSFLINNDAELLKILK